MTHHPLRLVGEPRHVERHRGPLLPAHHERAFADVHRQIADPFERGVDLDGGDDEPQVAGDRLVERQGLETLLLDFDFLEVDLEIAVDRIRSQRFVVPFDRGQGASETVLDERAQPEDALLELFDLALQVRGHIGVS